MISLSERQLTFRVEGHIMKKTRKEELLALADDVTEMVKRRHPFDRGVKARRGVEF